MTNNPTAEPIGTEVHISCAANPITTFALGLCNCETGSHHVLRIQLSPSHVAKIFLTSGQVNRLCLVLDQYYEAQREGEAIVDQLAEPLPEVPGNPEVTE